jgi:hypothetical protein
MNQSAYDSTTRGGGSQMINQASDDDHTSESVVKIPEPSSIDVNIDIEVQCSLELSYKCILLVRIEASRK